MLQNYNFAIDIDKTLTNETVFAVNTLHSRKKEIEDSIQRCSLKCGVDAIRNKDFNIILITGRPERYRKATVKWLHKNDIYFNLLIMVPNDYYPKDFDMELYCKFKLEACIKNHVHFALDDNKEVVQTLRSHGINAQVVDGDFEVAFNKLFGRM